MMRILRHSDHLVQLTWYGMVNAWLVREADGLTLVDTGLPGSAAGIVRAASEAGGTIARVVITHGHLDKVGGLEGLRAELPDALVAIGRREARLLLGDSRPEPGEMSFSPGPYFPRLRILADRLVDSGDRVGSLLMVQTPGHTPGHVSWLDLRDRTLIAGDAFAGFGELGVPGFVRPWFPIPALGTWDRRAALISARALAALHPSRLAMGHGELVDGPVPILDRALARAQAHPAFGAGSGS
jgi:glyoxylase-like metal-dependent hydrolase (beta-lactamase superfamily II)